MVVARTGVFLAARSTAPARHQRVSRSLLDAWLRRCLSDSLESGFEKIALFVDPSGMPTHAARQLTDGRWTSKLGASVDIEHSLRDLEGDQYGRVALVLRRPVKRQEGA